MKQNRSVDNRDRTIPLKREIEVMLVSQNPRGREAEVSQGFREPVCDCYESVLW